MKVLETAILEMCRTHPAGFGPEAVSKALFPVDWQHFTEDVIKKAWEMYLLDQVRLTEKGENLSKDHFPEGDFLISKPISTDQG